ncbi:hypothetical protein HU200_043795 [Digitaria exilis]|uniref:Uncharacterized protein n=1 Tax=Digitaria exilis TaxID=1010633 RepID=A0A835BAK3_9POAL|nr:hypothetical protein HU200_043795 [Digitaria exilis]
MGRMDNQIMSSVVAGGRRGWGEIRWICLFMAVPMKMAAATIFVRIELSACTLS